MQVLTRATCTIPLWASVLCLSLRVSPPFSGGEACSQVHLQSVLIMNSAPAQHRALEGKHEPWRSSSSGNTTYMKPFASPSLLQPHLAVLSCIHDLYTLCDNTLDQSRKRLRKWDRKGTEERNVRADHLSVKSPV